MDSFYEREMESFQREMERLSKMRWSKMEIDNFYREHVCDSNLLEFPCPCRICKRMITIDEFNHHLCCTCDRQADIDEGKCSFIIHKSCTKTIPRHIPQHPFHVPQHDFALSSGHHLSSSEHQDICNACGDDLKMGFVYKCSTPDCSFALDVKCAFLTLSNKSIDHHDQGGDLRFPLHPHRLFSCNEGKYFSYSCTCCKLPFTDVDRAETSLLVCLECKALLHKSCAEIPRKIKKHPFHPSLSLDLLPRVPYPGPCFKCNLCRQTKQDGFAYQCVECSIFLDVRCASLKPKKKNGDGDGDDSQKLRHFHPLIVCEDEENTFPRTCYTCGACGGHPFRDGDKMYFCPECDCLLDQSCADHFTQDIKHVLHPEHKLTFWYRPLLSGYRKCQACSSSIGDSGYQCFTCAFYLDIKCAMSKPTILHDSADRKPLVLHEAADLKQRCKVCNNRCDTSFFRRLGGDSVVHVDCMTNFPAVIQSSHQHRLTLRGLKEGFQETFFCMVCQKIEGKSPHYSCQMCPTPYNAHPHCVVNQLSEKMTFQDFKASNKDQKMEVDNVLQAYGRKDKPNWLYDSHTATKNIWMSNETLIRTPWEYWDAESEVIETDTGIYILKVFAPLLNALVNKYGDFCSGSTLSQLPKMFFVTTVCEVLHNMSITDVKDVTKDMLLTWFQGFALGKHAGLDMAFAFDRLLRVAAAHFGLHAGLFIDPNFAKVGDDEVAERGAPVTHSPIISLGKFELHDELKEFGKEREELEKTPKGKRSTYEWKKEWLTDTLDLLREKAFVIPP